MSDWLSPVEDHDGLLMKREDLYRYPNGANGAKLRAAEALLEMAHARGYRSVVTAAACVSPQHALVASAAKRLGMRVRHTLGGTTAETAMRHTSVRLAAETGVSSFKFIPVGYNPALVASVRQQVAEDPDLYWLHYGIATPPGASDGDLRTFHDRSANQVRNLPLEELQHIVLPFGSGNTGAGVLWGLQRYGFTGTVHLMCIGPDRLSWLWDRLDRLDALERPLPFELDVHVLHNRWARYGDRMPERVDGVEMHPTYEGKVVRYLDTVSPTWWTHPAGGTLLWIVGAPLPRLKGSSS